MCITISTVNIVDWAHTFVCAYTGSTYSMCESTTFLGMVFITSPNTVLYNVKSYLTQDSTMPMGILPNIVTSPNGIFYNTKL